MALDELLVPPLVIGSDDGIAVFASVGAVVGELEAIDVEDGVYGPAFDSEGRLFALEVLKPDPPPAREARWRKFWRLFQEIGAVEVRLVEEQPTHQSELRELLVSVLGEPPSTSPEQELKSLLRLAVKDMHT